MAAELRAFCDKLVAKFQQAKDLMSVEDFVKLHRNLPITAAAAAAATPATRSSGNRNDLRTIPVVGGSVTTAAVARSVYSIFADPALHHEAAATLASLAQQSSGFTGSVASGNVLKAFEAYMDDFSALHWTMETYQDQSVHHNSQNHSQFVTDLVATAVQPLRLINADESTITSVSDAIRQLASTVSSSTGNSSAETTLYSSFSISRTTAADPVLYGIYFTTLDMDHQANKKSNVITSDSDTYVFVFRLNSALLVQYAYLYDQLVSSSIEEWINRHTI